MQRVVVVGTSGAGKTTFARTLAQRLDAPHVELDALHWEQGWTPARPDIFRERVVRALDGSTWVVDGNYSVIRDLIWSRADTVIWLDYSLPVILAHLARRTFRRVAFRTELWAGNRERLRDQFTRESMFYWAISTYARRRRQYIALFDAPEQASKTLVRLASPRRASRWLRAHVV